MRRALVVIALAGCHVTARDQVVRPIARERVTRSDAATARAPTLVVTDAGGFRFVEPLECPTDEVITRSAAVEVETRANLATFVVGLIATGVGGVLAVRGAADEDAARSPFLYGGLALAGGGLPLAIGPWLGTGRRFEGVRDVPPERRPGPAVPCGARALGPGTARLRVRGLDVYGRVDADGGFAVSPYDLVDAFAPDASGAWDATATLELAGGARTIRVTLDGGALATHARAFLAAARFDARIEPIRLVPGLRPGPLRASLADTAAGPTLRLALDLRNDGPGPAWAVRGHVVAPGTPAIDGRVLYAGAIARGATGELAGVIPIDAATAAHLRNATIELSIELRDAHGTAPTTPVRLAGPILVGAPR